MCVCESTMCDSTHLISNPPLQVLLIKEEGEKLQQQNRVSIRAACSLETQSVAPIVLDPDPRKRLEWKCTLHLVCRYTSDWL